MKRTSKLYTNVYGATESRQGIYLGIYTCIHKTYTNVYMGY
jgi:hypothetical protein